MKTYNGLIIVNQGKTKTHFGRSIEVLTHCSNFVSYKQKKSYIA